MLPLRSDVTEVYNCWRSNSDAMTYLGRW